MEHQFVTEIDGVCENLSVGASVALDDNAIQSQKYTSIGRFQLFLKVFVALACARIGAQLAARRSAFNRLGLTRTLATCVQAQLADVYGTNSYGLSVRSRLGPIVCPFTLAARRKVLAACRT